MRSLLLLAVLATTLSSAWEYVNYGQGERLGAPINVKDDHILFPTTTKDPVLFPSNDEMDPLNENESIDSIVEKKAYFAFKLKNEKLHRRVQLVQEMAKQRERENRWSYDNTKRNLNESFVSPRQLELRLTGFYFDPSEQRERLHATTRDVARSLCEVFPRYLSFNRFVVDYGMIRGRLQDVDLDEQPIKKILSKNGFIYRADSDIVSGEYSGFVAVREHASLKTKGIRQLTDAAKIFLQKPLRVSVYVDTLYACTENAAGYCDEFASVKIRKCDKLRMRSLLFLITAVIALSSAWEHENYASRADLDIEYYGDRDVPPLRVATDENKDPLNENESIDSIFEKKAYFAFKLKNEKLQRRVQIIQELSKQKQQGQWSGYSEHFINGKLLSTSFVPAHQLELRLTGSYYDEAEQRERLTATFREVTRSLCDAFPRYLTFSRFVVDYGMIRGRLQETDIDEKPIKKILSKNGFTFRADSDIASGEYSGFVAVREHEELKKSGVRELSEAAKIFLQKPLRTSVYVDTLYACVENAAGYCDEIASAKIEKCDKLRVDL